MYGSNSDPYACCTSIFISWAISPVPIFIFIFLKISFHCQIFQHPSSKILGKKKMPDWVRVELRRKVTLPYCVFFINVSRHTQHAHIPVFSSQANTSIFRLRYSLLEAASPFAASHVLLLSGLWTSFSTRAEKTRSDITKRRKADHRQRLGTRTKSVTHQGPFFLLLPLCFLRLVPISPCTPLARLGGTATRQSHPRGKNGMSSLWPMTDEPWAVERTFSVQCV